MHRTHAMPFGAEITNGGVRFALWAPTARDVALVVDGSEQAMPDTGDGWRKLVFAKARAGSRYGFRIDGGQVVPDPASRFQPDDVHKPSEVVDPRRYRWRDGGWRGRPWQDVVLYELHVGTATEAGTYAALAERLADLADLGVTAVELMPLADFGGRRNWGYDGVLPFAPESGYGRPDDLKGLVDRAHELGLMMVLDVVYNHFGPTGNYLHAYAETFFTDRHQTPWGAGINFDGAAGPAVRQFFVHNALYWLEEFHFDGLRFDAVDWILDDSERHILREIAETIRSAFPDRHIHLALENGANEAGWLGRDDGGAAPLYNAQWNDDIHHCWHALLTGEDDGYYADYADKPVERLGRCLAEGFAYQGDASRFRDGKMRGEPSGHLPPAAFVSFIQNHDQIGNRALGERLPRLAPPERLALARAGLLLAPHIPLMFMGDEWAASTPFLFFVDFPEDPDLARAVREGRRREFERFRMFGESVEIPDPTALETFESSRIEPAEAMEEPHAGVLAETRDLLALRHAEIVPLTKTAYRGARCEQPAPAALDVLWRYAGGDLRFLANFGDAALSIETGADAPSLWTSAGVSRDGAALTLPPWTGAFLRSAPR